MYVLLIYDITDDKIRNKIAERLKDYGLKRVQYSAFWGKLNQNRREELMFRIQGLLSKTEGSIILIPVCERDRSQIIKLENFDIDIEESEKKVEG
ncbi:CRISPR-associated endonuclease Cas2 [Vulcanibacillus modesticaldus]|uniref:CRISPR-associated endoribonuclease Cas2 n=1 Tax=Vulcanibacillus modesticaldus TaxID=337097 RepID=A0A1D2YX01_9BACI|nr:CRISPR-associated endonuclease Cas2 [Vulcanibacillus modesticaldus]OEG00198.1 CRISPR-associated endonuclease Cas2 [Vulcanibacillus modesticaldus]